MATLVWNFKDREGTGRKDDIDWMMFSTRNATEDEDIRSFRTHFAKMSEFTAEQIEALMKVTSQQRKGFGVSLRTYDLPFLETNLSELARLDDAKAVAEILNVRAQLKIFNEMVEEAREFYRMTFDESITGSNRDAVMTTLEDRYKHLAIRAKSIADSIERSLSVLSKQ